ncbi:hypothetical protein DB346_21075 [Verrucomicrobia bacterium LW23]|nr:hypothetical protein DB346_21075 [Verrucomicrobia bacterium LW23]
MAWSFSSLLSSRRNGLQFSRRNMLMETLEDRILFDAVPVVTVDMEPGSADTAESDARPMINEQFQFTATFTNPSAGGATNPGYGPYIDIKTPDGVDLQGAPTYLGTALQLVQAYTTPGTHSHAITGQTFTLAAGEEFYIYELPFGSFVVDQEPLDVEFTAITNKATESAQVGVDLEIEVGGGFRYGNTPTGTTVIEAAVDVGTVTPKVWEVGKDVVIHEDETATGSNFHVPWQLSVDVASGEMVHDIVLTDQLPNNLMFVGNVTFISPTTGLAIGAVPPTYWSFSPAGTPSEPGGTLTVNLGAYLTSIGWTGGVVGTDFIVQYDTYVPEFEHDDADGSAPYDSGDPTNSGFDGDNGDGVNGDPVLDPITGQPSISRNGVTGTAWYDLNGNSTNDGGSEDLIDSPDPLNEGDLPNTDTLIDRSLAIQKYVSNVDNPSLDVGGTTGFLPGDELEYQLEFQVSDYFSFNDLYIVDRLGDGQTFLAGSPVTFTWTEYGTSHTTNFDNTLQASLSTNTVIPGGFLQTRYYGPSVGSIDFVTYYNTSATATTITVPGAGTISLGAGETIIVFNVSARLARIPGEDGVLDGAYFGPLTDSPGTTGSITFRVDTNQEYVGPHPGDPSIDIGDSVGNTVDIYGVVNVPGGSQVSDDSGAGVVVPPPELNKEVYAVNGSTAYPSPPAIAAGETISYELTMSLPISDIEQLEITDFVPLPKFLVTEFATGTFTYMSHTMWAALGAGFVPAAGDMYLVVSDAVYANFLLTGNTPGMTWDAATNSFTVDVGTFDLTTSSPTDVRIYFTLTTTSVPMRDELYLTNQMVATYFNTGLTKVVDADIVQVRIKEPVLEIVKGVVDSDKTAAASAGGVAFTETGTTPDFTGTMTDAAIAAFGAINLTSAANTDAGDTVRYAIMITNSGSASAYDVTFTDTIPAGFTQTNGAYGSAAAFIAATNFRVYSGNGTLLSYNPAGGIGTYDLVWDSVASTFTVTLNDNPVGADAGAIGRGQLDPSTPVTDGSNMIVVVYDLVVATSAAPNQTITNTATITNYASSNGGTDFTETDPDDDATIVTANPTPSKAIVATSVAATTGSSVVIGEIVRYRLVWQIPEGTTYDLSFFDDLPSGLQFINDGTATLAFVSNGGGITSTNVPSTHVSAFMTGNAVPMLGNTYSIPSTYIITTGSDGGTISFHMGDVVNSDSDADAEYVVIEFNAIVTNISGNQSGVNRANNFQVRTDEPWDSPRTLGTSNTVTVTIREPVLTIDKDITVPSGTPPQADESDVVTYSITVQNTGTATAYDIRVQDLIPSLYMDMVPGSLTISVLPANITVDDPDYDDNTIDFTIGSLGVGASFTITYQVLVLNTVLEGDEIDNTASVRYTSLPSTTGVNGPGLTVNTTTGTGTTPTPVTSTPTAPGTATGERTGDGGVNDYTTSDTETLHIGAPTIDLLWKDGTLTNDDTSLGSSTGADTVIGEHAFFDILVTVPEGTTQDVVVSFTLPPGMTYLDADLLVSSGLSALLTGSNAIGTGIIPSFIITQDLGADPTGQTYTFTLGDITVPTSAGTLNNAFVIRVEGRVDNVAGNQENTQLHPSAQLTYTRNDSSLGTVPDTVDANTPVPVVAEPTLTLDKQLTTAGNDGGDTVTYTIVIDNTSDQTAYDLAFSDVLQSDFSYGSVTFTATTALLGNVAGFFTYNNVTGTLSINTPGLNLAFNDTLTITISAIINGSVDVETTITNAATVYWSSLPAGVDGDDTTGILERNGSQFPGGLNDYGATDSVSFTTDGLSAEKTIVATGIADNDGDGAADPTPVATIGETITYRITVTVPDGETPDLIIQDLLPAGLTYVSGSASVLPLGFNGTIGTAFVSFSGGILTINFNSIIATSGAGAGLGTAQNTFAIEFQARVLDVPANSGLPGGQTELQNSIAYNDGKGGPSGTPGTPVPATVVEPVLEIEKTTISPATADAGDTVTFQIQLTNTGTSTGYDTVVTDLLDASYFDVLTAAAGALPLGWSFNLVGNTVTLSHSGGIAVNEVVTLTFTVNLLNTLPPGTTGITNTASAVTTTLPGTSAFERTTDPVEDDAGVTTTSSLNVTKSLVDTSQKDNGANAVESTGGTNVVIGETATYRVAVELQQGTTRGNAATDAGVLIHESLPTGMSLVPGATTAATSSTAQSYTGYAGIFFESAAGVTAVGVSGITYANGQIIDIRDITFGPGAGQFQFNFHSVTVPAGGGLGTGIFSVRYTALVENVGTNTAGTTLTNTVSVDADLDGDFIVGEPGESDTATPVTLTVVEPSVNITITPSTTSLNLGDTFYYDITLTAASGALFSNAYDVSLAGLLPPGVTFLGFLEPDPIGNPGVYTLLTGIGTDVDSAISYGPGGLGGVVDIAEGGTVTFRVEVQMTDNPYYIGGTYGTDDPLDAIPDNNTDQFTYTPSITWTSIDNSAPIQAPGTTGGTTGERDGSGGVNTYADNASSTITVVGADLSITKDDSLTQVVPGQTITYVVVVRNIGTSTATGLVVSDTLPLNAGTLVSISFNKYDSSGGFSGSGIVPVGSVGQVPESGTTPSSFTLSYANPSLAPINSLNAGEWVEFIITVQVDAVVDHGVEFITNTASVTFDQIAEDVTNGDTHGTPGDPDYHVEVNNNTASDTDFVDATPDLAVTKVAVDSLGNPLTDVNAGDFFTYVITVTNVGNQDLGTGYYMVDDLSQVLFVADYISGFDTTGAPIIVTPVISGTTYSFALSALAGSGGTQQFTLNFQALTPLPPYVNDFTNYVWVPTEFTTGDPLHPVDTDPTPGPSNPATPGGSPTGPVDVNDNVDQVTITLPTIPDLVVTKTVDTTLIELNEIFTYTITVTNIGNRSVDGLTVVDVLPPGLVVVDTDGGTLAFNSVTGNWEITWVMPGTFLGNNLDTYTFTVQAYLPNNSTASGYLTNTVTVTDDSFHGPGGNPPEVVFTNNSDTVLTPVRGADLRITKDDGLTTVVPGQSVTYMIRVTNFGTDTATGVRLTDILPQHLTLGSVLVNGVLVNPTLTSNGFVIPLANIRAGETVTIQVVTLLDSVVSAGFESMTNTVTVTHSIVDRTPENNTASDTDIVDALPGLQITKVANVVEAGPRDVVTYTITIVNPGNQDASDVVLTDDLDERIVTFLSATLGGRFNGDIISWELGTLAGGGGTITITVTVQVNLLYPFVSQLENTATTSYNEALSGPDPTPDNNTATAVVDLLPAFTYDSFSNFATWRPFGQGDEDRWGWDWNNLPYQPPMLTLAPMYSGAADPGSTLVLEIFNAMGVKVGTQTVVVDTGGNWLATFPSTILHDYPQTVVITEQPSPVEDASRSGFNLRTYFSPAINSSHFFYQQPDVNKVMSQMPQTVLENLYQGTRNPVQVGGEKYRYEFLSAQGTPSS